MSEEEKDMNKLGIFVTNPHQDTWRHLKGIVKAVQKAGKTARVFFTFKSVHLVQQSDFLEFVKMIPEEDFAICHDSYTCEGFDGIPTGLTEKQMRSQAYHGDIVDVCGKYISL
ncbi:MAG: hypothetical protein JRI35_00275 [Deltaproteobacteria bacterium]|nr:hypothetical protein [Deltaproteobacteria bacterium]MBW1965845.1 hypothetical protein [Deltaproteobacteria bacterium]MBW2097877.1 hypothetical protein [Deltaproteobacteria bacterium]